MTSIQTALLALPGSLSNSWGDYDNDGDLDLAVSLKSGEIRLYRNDEGVLVSVGAASIISSTSCTCSPSRFASATGSV